MLQLCTGTIIEKRRHLVPLGDITWEVDVFSGAHDGLILAEVELPETAHHIDLPDWLGPEVTGDPQFYNSTSLRHRRRSVAEAGRYSASPSKGGVFTSSA